MPPTSPLSVAVAQPAVVDGDLATTARAHAELIREGGAQLVVFPEMSLTGYHLDVAPVDCADPRLVPIVEACAESNATALVGAPIEEAGRRHIAVLEVDQSGIDVAYRKMSLGPDEARHFAPGPAAEIVEVGGWRIGVGICLDTRIESHLAETASRAPDLYAAGLVHAPEEAGEFDERANRISELMSVPVALSGFAGPTGGGYHQTSGGSGIWNRDGSLLACAGAEPGTAVQATVFPPR